MNLPPEFSSTVFILDSPPSSLPPAFAIITAWNPDGVVVAHHLNEAADCKLLAELQRRGVVHFRATGGSPPDLRAHHEDGWAAVISKEDAIQLGLDYRQLGIWWIENDNLILVNCATGDEQTVARFSERITGR